MKLKSVFFTFPIALLALTVLIGVSSPVLAQKSSGDQIVSERNTVSHRKDADYWFDKGALCATYGNDKAAIKYFRKVIAGNPERSDAYFEQGISYGQLEKFFKAIPLINKAIELEPQNGLYYYGRGRVYLLAGEKEKAMKDFKKAVELDNEDALNYLDMIAGTQ